MLLDLAPGWSVDVDRGPDWLFIRVNGDDGFDGNSVDFADRIWRMLEQAFTRRVVLELDALKVLPSHLIGELVRLHKRVTTHGGLMRIAGLSDQNHAVLLQCRLADRFPQYRDREEAVMGFRPTKPR